MQQFENEEFYVEVDDRDTERPLFDAACVVFSLGRKMLDWALTRVPNDEKVLSEHPCGRNYLTLDGVRTLCKKSKSKKSRRFRDWFENAVVNSVFPPDADEVAALFVSEDLFPIGDSSYKAQKKSVELFDEQNDVDTKPSSKLGVQETHTPNNLVRCFDNGVFNVRTVMRDGEPWFVARDVCDCLTLTDTNKACQNLDDDEKQIVSRDFDYELFSGSKAQAMTLISESGLYTLIMRSNKPEAKSFRKWVTGEVLPAIRKTGMYVPQYVLDRISTLEGLYQEMHELLILQTPKSSFKTARDVCEELGLDVVDTTFMFAVSSYMKSLCDQHPERDTYSRGFNGVRVFPEWVTDDFILLYRINPKILDPYLP
jgi:prophage antirepressor-like protein